MRAWAVPQINKGREDTAFRPIRLHLTETSLLSKRRSSFSPGRLAQEKAGFTLSFIRRCQHRDGRDEGHKISS